MENDKVTVATIMVVALAAVAVVYFMTDCTKHGEDQQTERQRAVIGTTNKPLEHPYNF